MAAKVMCRSLVSDCAAKAQDEIQKAFDLSWKEVLEQGYDKLKKCETKLKCGGCF